MRLSRKNRCIITSALLLYLALTIPAYCFLCAFLYLVPLFYLVIRNDDIISFKEGMMWGILLYGLHWYDVAILAHTQGQGIARYAVMPVLVIYSVCYSGIWFWIASRLTAITNNPAVIWIGVTWIYTIFMQRVSFWILGRVQGYPFSFPLIPFAEYPSLLFLLQYLHSHVLLLLLIITSWCCAYAWHDKKLGSVRFAAALSCYAPFALGLLIVSQKNGMRDDLPPRYRMLGYVSPAHLSDHLLERAGELADCCNKLIRNNPQITHILMPESTFAIALNANPIIWQTLTHNLIDETLTVVLGAPRKDNEGHYNCCYYLRNRLIIQGYDKSLTMPLTESIPNNWFNFAGINRIFLHHRIIMNSNSKKGAFVPVEGCNFDPKICSDYYLDWYDEPQETTVPLLLMVNETWFNGKVFPHLMKLAAQYGALARRQDIMYVGYKEGIYFSRDGQAYPLIQ